jgi:predicted ribonuclease YlaK
MDINVFSDRVTKLLTGKKTLLNEVKDQIHMLHKDIKNMCLFLVKVDGAEHADIGAIKQKMVELAYHADDALDRYMVNSKLQHTSEYDIKEDRKRLLKFLRRFNKRVDSTKTEIHKVYANPAEYNIVDQIQAQPRSCLMIVRKEKERQLISKEPRMVGRGAEMEKLLDLLIEGDPQLAIISIVGEAGLGKTTLAAEAYNSVYVKNYFDCRAWVHVVLGICKC